MTVQVQIGLRLVLSSRSCEVLILSKIKMAAREGTLVAAGEQLPSERLLVFCFYFVVHLFF
jgi:hypothetical protein